MGILVAVGFEIIIAGAIALLCCIIGLLIGQIIIFESIALGITAAALLHYQLSVHLFFAILIGLTVGIIVFWLLKTRIGFWLISAILSFAWCFIVGMVAWSVTGGDMVWGYGMMAVGFVAFMGLHYLSYSKLR